MRLQLARWGNSLAVRLPREYMRAVGLQKGDHVGAIIAQEGMITLMPDRGFKKDAFLRRLAKLHTSIRMTKSVAEQMRREAGY